MIPIFANQKIRVSYKTTENITLLLRGQVRLANGEVVDISKDKQVVGVTSGEITAGTIDKDVPAGELISLTIKTNTTNIQRGMSFLRANIIYSGDESEALGLCAKYITTDSPVNLGQFEDSLSGRGCFRTRQVNDPAAGEEFQFTGSVSIYHKILSLSFDFASAVAAANRMVKVKNDDVGSIISFAPSAQVASITGHYVFAQNTDSNAVTVGTHQYQKSPLRDGYITYPGGVVVSECQNIQAADQYSAIVVQTEEWISA